MDAPRVEYDFKKKGKDKESDNVEIVGSIDELI